MISKDTIIDIVSNNYNIGSLISEPVSIPGDIDLNYKITTETGNYLLKQIVNIQNLPQFEILGDVHQFLINNSVLVPKILKTKNGKYVEDNFILYEFIDGEKREDWSKDEIIFLTTNFAKMLEALKHYPVPEFIKNKTDKYTKAYDIEYCYKTYRSQILDLDMDQNVKDSIVKTIDILYSKLEDFNSLPKYFVHGDLNEMNALFKDGKNVGIIDIGGAYDPIVYDLGEFLYWFTLPNWSENFDVERYGTIIETFDKLLPLSSMEKELIPYMMLRRGMMDVVLTLEHFWSGEGALPEKRLQLLTNRNNKIIELTN